MGSYESHSLFWVVCVGVVVTDDDVRDGNSWAITAILIPFPQWSTEKMCHYAEIHY